MNSNMLKTTFLLTALTLMLIWIGGAIGGRGGMMFAFVLAALLNFSAYWFSDRMVLAMYRAKPLSEAEAPHIYAMIERLAMKAGMPMPRIYRIPTEAPNAFATGRNPKNAVVAVTDGILGLLSEEELEGVLAHELAHVEHRDILISTIAATLAGAVSMLAGMARWAVIFGGARSSDEGRNPIGLLIASIVAPLAAMLVQLAVSRSREFHADERGAVLAGNPYYLARALRKLEAGASRQPMTEVNPATAHLFIVNPLRGQDMAKLFSTHPPVEERVARLERMAV